jgi:ATP/ADP translocase
VLVGVLMHFYVQASTRLPRRWVLPMTQVGLVGVMVLFWLLFPLGQAWVDVALYVFNFMLGVLLTSQFWTLANDLYDSRQARRIFGFIGAGACLGGALGSLVTEFSVQEVGTDNLALVSAGMLAICAAIVTTIIKRQPALQVSALEDEHGVGAGEAIRLLVESRHLRLIAVVIGFAAVGAVLVEQQLNLAAEASKGANQKAITAFLARIGFYISMAGFVVQIGLTSRVHRTLGLIFALLLLPVTLGSMGIVILLNAALWAPGVARVFDSSLRYSIDKTTREVLFLPLPADLKHRAKPFIDVTVDRLAKALGAVLVLVLIKPWGLNLTWWQVSYASLAITGLWIALALVARREYLATFRRSLTARVVEPASVRLDVTDPATLQTLVAELSSPDEASVVYAIEMLEILDKRSLISPLLLHHGSPRVRARALVALASAPDVPADAAQWIPAVQRLLKDDDVDVRAAAVRALAALRHEEAPALMREFLDDANPRVAVTAAIALADTGLPGDAKAAEKALLDRIADTRVVAAETRRDVAAGLARIQNPAFRSLLIPLIHDPEIDVALEAVRSARRISGDHALFVPALVSLLGHRVLKTPAREALIGFGDGVVDMLAYVLRDRDEQAWVRRHVPATLARLPSAGAVQVLVDALDEPDGFLRYKVIEALETLRRERPALASPSRAAEAWVLKETARYCRLLTLRAQLGDQSSVRSTTS